ncbi:uncharacterized protein LOC115631274 [Scaptodrosophila lebanonensis]|uniref:Uncharacterized protein LOC115631274 n=1 Tax=Drosophila lebanonensis TaxID=7225 RepID=A0A6J2U7A2_DROLE|nr:uncharacterized protein LOC115631274 [Scaptodrosophila lebanonensis]
MGFRFFLLAAMGLGAMYMMHLLAQDWTRIRPIRGATQLLMQASSALQLNRNRRDTLRNELGWVRGAQDTGGGGAAAANGLRHPALPTPGIDWKRILSRDPFECLQSLICQLMSGAEAASQEAELLMDFLESSVEMAPAKIGRAFSRGLALRGSTDRCYDEYPFCLYSAKTMLRILRWFSEEGTDVEDR